MSHTLLTDPIQKTTESIQNELFKKVQKVALADIMPGYKFPAGSDYAIVDEYENILNFCSGKYNLVPNEEVFPQVEKVIKEKGLEFKRNIRIINGSKFYVDYIIKKGMDLKVNEVYPKISVWNSYDGAMKFRTEFGFYRLVCSNGLATPTGFHSKNITKHSINYGINVDSAMESKGLLSDFIKSSSTFLSNIKEDLDLYEWMGTESFNLEKMERIASKAGLSKKMLESAKKRYTAELTGGIKYLDINDRPAKFAGTTENMFIGYNALNYAIYNINDKELPEKKLEKDIQLINAMKEELVG